MESDLVKLVRRLNPQDYEEGYLAGLHAAQAGMARAVDLQAAQAGIAQIIQDFERIQQTIKRMKVGLPLRGDPLSVRGNQDPLRGS